MQRALVIALLSLVIVACKKAPPEQQVAQPMPAPEPAPEPAPAPVDPAPTPDPSAGTPTDPATPAQTKTDPATPAPAKDPAKDPATPAKDPAKDPAKTPAPIAKGEPNPNTPSKGPGPRPRGPGLHEPCGTNDTCANGMKCMKYYGIAGPRGPEFKTCEVPCDKTTKCPSGTSCGTIADGPGQVCR